MCIRDRNCAAFKDEEVIRALGLFYRYEPYNSMGLAFIDGEPEGVREIILWGMKKCLEEGRELYTLKPAQKRLHDIGQSIGMENSEIGMALVYEYPNPRR